MGSSLGERGICQAGLPDTLLSSGTWTRMVPVERKFRPCSLRGSEHVRMRSRAKMRAKMRARVRARMRDGESSSSLCDRAGVWEQMEHKVGRGSR
jgi:hypothetical protein